MDYLDLKIGQRILISKDEYYLPTVKSILEQNNYILTITGHLNENLVNRYKVKELSQMIPLTLIAGIAPMEYERVYKVNDKVLLKDNIDTSDWQWGIENEYNKLNPRVVTIIEVYNILELFYYMEEISGIWYNDQIVGIHTEPINDRFEILDL